MKKHHFLLLIFTVFIFSCHKDVEKQILGKWEISKTQVTNINKYIDSYKKKFNANKDELEQEKNRIQALPESYFPVGIVMEFGDSSKFYLGGIEGKWTYYPDKNMIKVNLALIDSTLFKIKKITSNYILLKDRYNRLQSVYFSSKESL